MIVRVSYGIFRLVERSTTCSSLKFNLTTTNFLLKVSVCKKKEKIKKKMGLLLYMSISFKAILDIFKEKNYHISL